MAAIKGTMSEARKALNMVRNGQKVSVAILRRALLVMGNACDRARMSESTLKDTLKLFRGG